MTASGKYKRGGRDDDDGQNGNMDGAKNRVRLVRPKNRCRTDSE